MSGRVCTTTGLALTASPVRTVRIARESLGPFAPRPRGAGEDVTAWSRYDTVGRTVYSSDDRLTSYMELLSPYRTKIDEQRRALQNDADFMGISLETLWRQVVEEWDEAGNMKARWLPRAFREGRAIYDLAYPAGWWVDITTIETINAITEQFSSSEQFDVATGPLTLSQITGDDRSLTTSIAAWLREEVVLDDGSLPLGVRFMSKHGRPAAGTGICWAYWMREADHGLAEPATITASASIGENDRDLQTAQKHCNITTR